MMKRILMLVFCLMMLVGCAHASEGDPCAVYGEHRWYLFDQLTPTCTQSGWTIHRCDCGAQSTKAVPVAAHQWQQTGFIPASCEAEGLAFFECQQCHSNKTEVTQRSEHNFNQWLQVSDPTCTTRGLKQRTCWLCGYVDQAEVDTVPHRYSDWVITLPCTDHSMGARMRNCIVCNKLDSQDFYPAGTLHADTDSIEAVKALQTYLTDNGYLNSIIDGDYGKVTQKAVTAYQKEMGFEPTGIAYPQTLEAIFCPDTDPNGQPMSTGRLHAYGEWNIMQAATDHSQGSRRHTCLLCGHTERTLYYPEGSLVPGIASSQDVKELQQALIDLGYLKSIVDGDYGNSTQKGVRNFQRAMGFEETGIAYPQTLNALYAQLDEKKAR